MYLIFYHLIVLCAFFLLIVSKNIKAELCHRQCNRTIEECSVCAGEKLSLQCDDDEYVVAIATAGFRTTPRDDCCYSESDCQSPFPFGDMKVRYSSRVRYFLGNCAWKSSKCNLQVGTRDRDVYAEVGHATCDSYADYLNVRQFRCIKKSKVYKLQMDSPSTTQSIEVDKDGFITSPDFGTPYWNAIRMKDTRVFITIVANEDSKIDLETVVIDMPTCDKDFIEIRSVQSDAVHEIWCGKESKNLITEENELKISLVMGFDETGYRGFVIHYKVSGRTNAITTTIPNKGIITDTRPPASNGTHYSELSRGNEYPAPSIVYAVLSLATVFMFLVVAVLIQMARRRFHHSHILVISGDKKSSFETSSLGYHA